MGLTVDERGPRRLEHRRAEHKKGPHIDPTKRVEPAKFEEKNDQFLVTRRKPKTSGVTQTSVQGKMRDLDRPLHSSDYPSFRASVESIAPDRIDAATSPEQKAPDTSVLTPERKQQIDAYNKHLADEHFEQHAKAGKDAGAVADALAGRSDLGAMNPAEQKYLLQVSLDRWTDKGQDSGEQNVNYNAINALAERAHDDPKISTLVADAYATRASDMTATAHAKGSDFRTQELGATLAVDALDAAGSAQGRRDLLERLGPEQSANLAESLSIELRSQYDGGSFGYGSSLSAEHRTIAMGQLLEAASRPPPSSATQAAVDTAFQMFPAGGYGKDFPGDVSGNMARAIAAHWYPNDPSKREAEANRLAGVLGTHQGRELLANDDLTLEDRLKNLDLVRSHSEWNEDFFKTTDHAYDNPSIAFALAGPTAVQYRNLRGDDPVQLSGSNLENTIGFAMGFPPQGVPQNETDAQRDARESVAAKGQFSYFKGEPAGNVVGPVADSIRHIGGDNPQVTVLPVQYASANTGTVSLPLFRVQDSSGRDRFVDNTGRTYDSFDDWKKNNQLPPGNMTYPVGGHLSPDVKIETKNTPNTVDSFGEHLDSFLDHAALVGGVIAGGAILLGSGGTLAPVVLGGAAAWGTYRGVEQLNDRWQHGQSLNPLSDEGARAAWLGVGANAASLVSLGATSVAGRLAAEGSSLAYPAATAAAYLRVGANVLDAGAALNAGYTLVSHYDELSNGDRASLALSAGFWGINMLASSRVSGVRPAEMFNLNAIRDATLYGHLDPSVQTELRTRIRGADEGGQDILQELALSERFRGMSSAEQLNYLRANGDSIVALSKNTGFTELAPGSQRALLDQWDNFAPATRNILLDSLKAQSTAGDRELIARLASSEAFHGLAQADRELLLRYVGGANRQLSGSGRLGLNRLFEDPVYRSGGSAEQTERLEAFLRDQPGLPEVVSGSAIPGGDIAPYRMYPGLAIDNVAFANGNASGTFYDVSIDGRIIPVYLEGGAPKPGLSLQTPVEIATALARLPPEVRASINAVKINTERNPGDAFWSQQFGDADFRSYMTADSYNGVVNVFPTTRAQTPDFLASSLVHEVGHFESQTSWGRDNTARSWQNWRDAMQSDRLSASGYAKNNPDEDFAETYALYFQVRGTPQEAEVRALMPERFRLIDEIVNQIARGTP